LWWCGVAPRGGVFSVASFFFIFFKIRLVSPSSDHVTTHLDRFLPNDKRVLPTKGAEINGGSFYGGLVIGNGNHSRFYRVQSFD
jgi:hypothetical protein